MLKNRPERKPPVKPLKPLTRLSSAIVLLLLASCSQGSGDQAGLDDAATSDVSNPETGSSGPDDSGPDDIVRDNPDWAETSHSNDVDPSYDVVFPDDQLLRLDITIEAADWATMQLDLGSLLDVSAGRRGPAVVSSATDENPMWVEATVEFQGKQWQHVGIRYKGNSTLQNAFNSNTDKYPFKLDFDEWEDDYPSIDDQRFYGFKQLNLGSNYDDPSAMKEKVAADLFRAFGVASARTSFCQVYLDRGQGSRFIGLYTLVEEVDDTVIDSQFAVTDGNLYKPDGTAASFAAGTYNDAEFDLKTNQDTGDYSDVLAFYAALHDDSRVSDPDAFQAGLEASFDVDQFLRQLAVNQVIQNWDTYGVMTHNFFLYNVGGRLTWIPWDNNEAFSDGKMGGALSLALTEVDNRWPILRYLIDVPEYETRYQQYLNEFITEMYSEEKMNPLYDSFTALIGEVASSENTGFESAVQALRSHVGARRSAVNEYLP